MFEARLEQGALLKKLLDAVKELVTDANFDCSATGFGLQAMDSSHVSLVSMMVRERERRERDRGSERGDFRSFLWYFWCFSFDERRERDAESSLVRGREGSGGPIVVRRRDRKTNALPERRRFADETNRIALVILSTSKFSALVFVPLLALIAPARSLSLITANRSCHRSEKEEK